MDNGSIEDCNLAARRLNKGVEKFLIIYMLDLEKQFILDLPHKQFGVFSTKNKKK